MDLNAIEDRLKEILLKGVPPLRVSKQTDSLLELTGTKPAM